MSPRTTFRVVLVVALMLLTSGTWAQQRVTRFVWAACQDAKTAVCVSRASQTQYLSGIVNGRTRRHDAVESCLMGYNHRLPELFRAQRQRVLVDFFRSDPNKATAQATQACLAGVVSARAETGRWMAAADAQFQAQRLAARAAASANAVASNQPPASPPPSASAPVEPPKADPATERAIGQLNQLGQATEAALHGQAPDDNPYVAPAPVVSHGTGPSGLGDDLVLLYENDREAAVYVKKNGQFYTVQTSFLSKQYATDWATVYTYPGNENRDMFGACFQGRKITLDQDRMHVKPWDAATLNGPVNSAFKEQCERDGGEFRFALQAGQVIKIPAKGSSSASVAPAPSPVPPTAPPAPRTWRRQPPSPSATASASASTATPVAPSATAAASASSAVPVAPVPPPATASAVPVVPTAPAAPSAPPTMSMQPPEADAAVATTNEPDDDAGVSVADASALPAENDGSVYDAASDAEGSGDAAQPDASADAGTGGTTGKSASWEDVILPLLYIIAIALTAWLLLETGKRVNWWLKKRRSSDDSGDDGDGTPPPTGGSGSSDPPDPDRPSDPPPASTGGTDPSAPSTPPPAPDSAPPPSPPRPKPSGFVLWWRTLKAWWEVRREEWRTGVPYVPPTVPPPTFRTVDVTPPPPAPTGFDDDGDEPADDSGGLSGLDDPDTDDPDDPTDKPSA